MSRTYILRDQGVRERAIKMIQQLDLAQCYELIVRPYEEKRTDEQSALFHVLLGKVASATGNNAKDVKDFFKAEFGPKKVVHVHGEARAVPKSQADWTVKEQSEMIDRAFIWARDELGVTVE